MTALRLLLPAALAALALAPPAAAGGWWSFVHLDRSRVAVGQRVEARAEVLFDSATEAREAQEDGRFYVYLLRGVERSVVERAMTRPDPRNWWSPGDAQAVKVGRLRLTVSHSNLAWARASFTVPDVRSGTYSVMLCDAGCARSLADDVVPTRFTVVADPATARLAERADRLEERLRRESARLAAVRAAVRRAHAKVADVGLQAEETQARVRVLEQRVGARESSAGDPPWGLAGGALSGGLVAVLALLGFRRRRVAFPAIPHRSGAGTANGLDRLGRRDDSARGRESAVRAAPRRAQDTDRSGARLRPLHPRPGASSVRGRGGRLPRS